MRVLLASTLAALAAFGCGLPPKPAALSRLEHRQRLPRYLTATKDAPGASRRAAEARELADGAWRRSDVDLAKHWAEVGLLRGELAVQAAEANRASRELKAVQAELDKLAGQRAALTEAIETADEKILLYEELAVAEISTKEKELELSDFQQRNDAERDMGKAALAIKLAETVNARQHAKRPLELAELALKQGRAALKKDGFALAARAAGVAKGKAEAAYALARPLYRKHQRAEDLDRRAEALQKEAAKLSLPSPPQVRTVGQSRQLVLSLTRLFGRRANAPKRSALPLLANVAKLLAKHPGHPVLVNGHTSSAVPRDRRYALSLDRARQVRDYLLTLGLPFSRFAVSGRGTEEPVGRRSSSKNDRVDVILLFQ